MPENISDELKDLFTRWQKRLVSMGCSAGTWEDFMECRMRHFERYFKMWKVDYNEWSW